MHARPNLKVIRYKFNENILSRTVEQYIHVPHARINNTNLGHFGTHFISVVVGMQCIGI